VFGANGARLQAIDLRAMGVHPRPSDFEVHRDGRLVMADPNESMLVRCTPPSGPCERIDVKLLSAPGQQVLPLNPAKLHIDERKQRYYVSDNAGHRVVVADFAGRVLGVSATGAVHYPNQLEIADGDELSVVDTGRKRIATFDVGGDRIGKVLRATATNVRGVARSGRFLPFDAVHLQDGRFWALIAREHMRDGDVILFDAKGVARLRLDLGDGSDPFDIESWRGRIWIADATNYTFESVAADGSGRGAIEDRAFAAELAEEKASAQRWTLYRMFARIGLVAIPLAAVLVMWKLGMVAIPRKEAASANAISPGVLMALRVTLALAGIFIVLAIAWRLLRLL
jgi:hypothetical protein